METEGLVLIRDLDTILSLGPGMAAHYRRLGVFEAAKISGCWRVPETSIPWICDRILRFRARVPYHPTENMTVTEAAVVLSVKLARVYQMGHSGTLAWAEDEPWKCVTKESVNLVLRRRGRREVA